MRGSREDFREDEGVEVPHRELAPSTLRRLIEEFVSRDGADWHEQGRSLEAKVDQVLRQLETGKARVVFNLAGQSADIVPVPEGTLRGNREK